MNAAAGLTIPNYAFGGAALGSGGLARIAPELDQVPVLSNLRAVIMNGGIDDLLVPDSGTYPHANECKDMGAASPNIPDCQTITQLALDALMAIFNRLANAGVEDVVYFSPPHLPTGTSFGADPNAMIDYMFGKIHSLCDATEARTIAQNPARPLRCHFVDMVPVFEGHPDYLSQTQIAETITGSQAMAGAIEARLDEDCVAQPASSGCCRR